MKQLLKSKLKDLPEEQRNKIIEVVEKNPEFFTKIMQKVQGRIANGKDQNTAMMEVMMEHKDELQGLMK